MDLRNKVATLPAVLLIVLLTSCGHSFNDSSAFKDIPEKGWPYANLIQLRLASRDSIVGGELSVAVDYANDYLYRNLWIESSCYEFDGQGNEIQRRDTLEFLLYDSIGNRLGTGAASTWQLEKSLGKIRLVTDKPIELRHIMRTDTLRNVNRVGILFVADK